MASPRKWLRLPEIPQPPLWVMGIAALVVLCVLVWWTRVSMRSDVGADGRQTIVFWGAGAMGDDIYVVVRKFEQENPQYKVVLGTAVARDLTGDAQRLLTAIAGNVPPDVVWFDRFAVSEWAARGAFADLRPMIAAQKPDDPIRIDLGEFYTWAIEEASYRRPGDTGDSGIYGIPQSADIRMLYCNANHLRQIGKVDSSGNCVAPKTWEELREYANLLTQRNDRGDITRLGFAPNYGNSWLYMYAWQAGGEFMSPDRRRITMDSPPVVRALKFMVDIYGDLGGEKALAVEQSYRSMRGAIDPFISGLISMKIDGNWSLGTIGDWAPNMEFTFSPAPIPADQVAMGRQPITWAGGWALCMPTTAKNKAGAFRLMQYLSSQATSELLDQGQREARESEGRTYMPVCKANRVQYERSLRAFLATHAGLTPSFRKALEEIRDILPRTKIRPVTPVGQLMWNQHQIGYSNAVHRQLKGQGKGETDEQRMVDEVRQCLAQSQVEVQRRLDQVLAPPPPQVVNWTWMFAGYGVLLVMPLAALWIAYRRNRRAYAYRAKEVGAAMLFSSPWMLGLAVFVGGPVLFSIIFSFTRYDVLSPARYVGFENYRDVFKDPLFYQSLGNTLFMVLRIPVTMAVSLAIALLLNRTMRGIGLFRTIFYIPAIVPLVASSLLWLWLFDPGNGPLTRAVNSMCLGLDELLRWLHLGSFPVSSPTWLSDVDWAKPSLIIMSTWTAGGGMIIWLAGLGSIPPQLYEAAAVDGAGPWRRFVHITLPMLSPFILFNLIVGLIHTLQIFGEAFIMTGGEPANATLFYAYHLFKQAFQFFSMGYASALAWILFVMVLGLTLLQVWLSKRWVHYERS